MTGFCHYAQHTQCDTEVSKTEFSIYSLYIQLNNTEWHCTKSSQAKPKQSRITAKQ